MDFLPDPKPTARITC